MPVREMPIGSINLAEDVIPLSEFRKALLTAGTAGNFPSCGAAEQQRQKPWR